MPYVVLVMAMNVTEKLPSVKGVKNIDPPRIRNSDLLSSAAKA
jgi:hypothetical protein